MNNKYWEPTFMSKGIKYPAFYLKRHTILSEDFLDIRKRFASGTPIGITIKASFERSLEKSRRDMRRTTEGSHIIVDRFGRIHQTTLFKYRSRHGGKVEWNGHNPDTQHIIVTLVSWGTVEPYSTQLFETSTGSKISKKSVAFAEPNIQKPGRKPKAYFWDRCSERQLRALKDFILWSMDHFEIPVENICGMDECRRDKGMRLDPGGVLPCTMEEFREIIRGENEPKKRGAV